MTEQIGKKKITFKYHGPEAKTVAVVGTFNGWNTTANLLKKDREGNWSSSINLFPGSYEYRFVVDGRWKDDPACEIRHLNIYGGYNCVLYVF